MVLAQIKFKELASLLNKEANFLLPKFSHQIPELCCEYQIPDSIKTIQKVSKSNPIEDAIQITLKGYRDIHLIVCPSFKDATAKLALAKKHKLSLVWIDSQVLNEISNKDSELDFGYIIANTALRKWVYCPIIDAHFMAWYKSKFGEAPEQLPQFIRSSDIEFKIEQPHKPEIFLSSIYQFDINTHYPNITNKLREDTVELKQLISTVIISLIETQETNSKRLASLAFAKLDICESTKHFIIYHLNLFDFSKDKFKREAGSTFNYQVFGLIDFAGYEEKSKTSMRYLSMLERKHKRHLRLMQKAFCIIGIDIEKDTIEVPYKIKELISKGLSENAHFTHAPVYSFQQIEKMKQHIERNNTSVLASKPRHAYVCGECCTIDESENLNCRTCGEFMVTKGMYNSLVRIKPSLNNVIRALTRKKVSRGLRACLGGHFL